jgi:hypothetical protein
MYSLIGKHYARKVPVDLQVNYQMAEFRSAIIAFAQLQLLHFVRAYSCMHVWAILCGWNKVAFPLFPSEISMVSTVISILLHTTPWV